MVFDPVRNDLFTASRGRGAFLNDRRIRVSRVQKLDDALVGTGFPQGDMTNLDRYLKMLTEVMKRASGIRRPGAAALDLAYVACGQYDAFWELGLKAWDVAAGSLLVQEAGGLVSDLSGEGNFIHGGSVVCGSPRVFGQLLPLLNGG